MSEDLKDIQFAPIKDHKYAQWFQEVRYETKMLSEAERKEFISVMDEGIAEYSEGLSLMYETIENSRDKHDSYHEIDYVVASVTLFVLTTMIDCMVISKYYVCADNDYEKRFMRGKMKVILNEGFKKLYGFEKNTHKQSEWNRLLPYMSRFPEVINYQHQRLTNLLEKHAKSSSWWKDERDLETHLDTEKLYISRQEEIIDSEVMKGLMKLFDTLLAVNCFLWNLHSCLYNFLVDKYYRGELKEE
ncbi:MAG: hypothetical protein J6Y32_04045 [Bacteroidales bacterium]|nr:hypothetical protein [Bacteroidales bacterium]